MASRMESQKEGSLETYTTASGIVLSIMTDEPARSTVRKVFVSALAEMPDGVTVFLNTTLSRAEFKQLAKHLILAQ